jgi:DNA/RNA endonuclease YhcR with UshA esterase domain
MKEEEITWEAVIKLFQSKPELVEKYTDIKINRDTFITDYRIKAARNVRTDIVFTDTEGQVRDVSLWNKRYAEDKGVKMRSIEPILITDEESIETFYNTKELDRFKIKYVTYKVSDIAKEL